MCRAKTYRQVVHKEQGVYVCALLARSGGGGGEPDEDGAQSMLCWPGLVEVVVRVLSDAALQYLERDERPGRKNVQAILLSLLELLHNLLRNISAVVRLALQVRPSRTYSTTLYVTDIACQLFAECFFCGQTRSWLWTSSGRI